MPSHAAVILVVAGLCAVTTAADSRQDGDAPPPRKRMYDVLMRDLASTFDSLHNSLDGGSLGPSAVAAEKLEHLFHEVEEFWAPFRTKDAIDAARSAREISGVIAVAARQQDLQKAKAAASGLGRYCTSCHNSHREQMPDKSYRIRP